MLIPYEVQTWRHFALEAFLCGLTGYTISSILGASIVTTYLAFAFLFAKPIYLFILLFNYIE